MRTDTAPQALLRMDADVAESPKPLRLWKPDRFFTFDPFPLRRERNVKAKPRLTGRGFAFDYG